MKKCFLSALVVVVVSLAAAPLPLLAQDPALYQGMVWRNIGPFRGGRSNASVGVPTEPRTFYFGSVGGGVFKTTDGGESWTNVTDGFLQTASVGAIAVADSDPNVIYVGMGEHAVRGVMTSHGDGVYKSTDAGRTWKHMGLPRSRAISRIRIHPADPDRVYVAVQGAPYGPTDDRGIYLSADGGESWERKLFVNETAGASDLAMDPTNPRILYAAFWDHLRTPWEVRSGGPGSGFFKSTDAGETWERIGDDPESGFPALVGKTSIAVSANPDRLYALVEADPKGGLYRSDDAGKSFSLVNEGWDIRSRAWYYIKVFADPRNADVVWVTNAQLLKSIDGGKTFERVQVPHGDNHHVWINPDNADIMINSNDGGANISYDGGASWSTQENQPTAQFYRVNTDHRFPYFVYGGQQDNSTVAIPSQTFDSGIDWKDWYAVGGCESAYVAFDRDAPDLIYAGCYMGQISEWDRRTRTARNVMAYPMLPAAMEAREMKYRFNWNAPILVSPHDPKVVYHAGNVLLRSRDRGMSWTVASPDLTRDDDEKQGSGGGPITNEGAGGEIYGTLYYVAESPRDAGTIWTGSDDGRIHLTRDDGRSWTDVTPDGLGEAMVNAIEASPHEAGTAYVAITKYKFNDFTPLAYKTSDYGRSWTAITNGIPAESWIRVVREDPKRRGLLYMGTETGMFVSFDDGAHFQSLQLNLPVTPVNDLIVQAEANDLVAATSGRAFWILDDLSPLQQWSDRVESAAVHLYAPRPAHRVERGGGSGGGARLGKNPPPGAIIDYALDEVPADVDTDDDHGETRVSLEILDGAGTVLRAYPGENDRSWKPKAGMNRMSWDLRHEPPKRVPGLYVFGQLRGRKVVPGTYQVRLTVGEEVRTQPLEVLRDPRLDVSDATFADQDAFLEEVAREISAIHEAVIRLRDVRSQIQAFVDREEGVAEEGTALVEKLDALENVLIQKRTVDGQTVINFPVQLNHHYIYLHGAVDGSELGVPDGARERLSDLNAQWRGYQGELDELLGPELDRFNALVRERGIAAVSAKSP